jgi:ssDNA-binding Zn-finger/Zn-ribbon topoisomerase 1
MMCSQCKQFPMRIKQSATGYLFASCEGFPKCKAAVYLPKLIRNIMVGD